MSEQSNRKVICRGEEYGDYFTEVCFKHLHGIKIRLHFIIFQADKYLNLIGAYFFLHFVEILQYMGAGVVPLPLLVLM